MLCRVDTGQDPGDHLHTGEQAALYHSGSEILCGGTANAALPGVAAAPPHPPPAGAARSAAQSASDLPAKSAFSARKLQRTRAKPRGTARTAMISPRATRPSLSRKLSLPQMSKLRAQHLTQTQKMLDPSSRKSSSQSR